MQIDVTSPAGYAAVSEPPAEGVLQLGHALAPAGIDPDELIVIRHVYRTDADHLRGPEDLADNEKVRSYTSRQGVDGKAFPATPPRYWIICIGEGRNARLITVYENHGELNRFTTDDGWKGRTFDLRDTSLLASYRQRLTFTWCLRC